MANIYKTKEEVDEVFVKPVPLDVLRDLAQKYLESGTREVSSEIQRKS
jgi:hypothetical protein